MLQAKNHTICVPFLQYFWKSSSAVVCRSSARWRRGGVYQAQQVHGQAVRQVTGFADDMVRDHTFPMLSANAARSAHAAPRCTNTRQERMKTLAPASWRLPPTPEFHQYRRHRRWTGLPFFWPCGLVFGLGHEFGELRAWRWATVRRAASVRLLDIFGVPAANLAMGNEPQKG